MKRICLIVSLAVLLMACGKTLSKKELANVLADMYLYESGFGPGVRLDSVSIYRSVFLKHGITEAKFRRSIEKYAFPPKHLKEVYVMVDTLLKERKVLYEALVAAELEIEQEKQRIKREEQRQDALYRFPADTSARHFLQRCALELDFELSTLFPSDTLRSSSVDTLTRRSQQLREVEIGIEF